MEERFRMVEVWRTSEESVAALARRFGVSRKTAYKWIERYELGGLEGLDDRSRAPHVQARRTPEEVERWVLDLRAAHLRWGPRKLRHWLLRRKPEQVWPAESTIALILARHGLSAARKKRRRSAPYTAPLAHARSPNDVWAIDFKGWFSTGDGMRCDPLTVSDAASRYLLCCRPVEAPDGAHVRTQLEHVFREHGLPARLRSDNGAPFASLGVGALSALSVWWIRLGIVPERIAPGAPQQNGRHERLHRTLKEETATPPAATVAEQQRRFDEFQRVYNQERPHEALGGATPQERYRPSARALPERLPELEYPAGLHLRKADEDGKIRWKQARCRVGAALAGEVVAVEEVDDGLCRLWFGPVVLGLLDERKGHSQTRQKGASHWPPLAPPSGRLAPRSMAEDHQEDGTEV